MASDYSVNSIKYIENVLSHKIIEKDSTLNGHKFVRCNATLASNLDGFMSNIFRINLTTEINGVEQTHKMVMKTMKGSEEFRIDTKSYTQFTNELFVYNQIFPYFKSLCRDDDEKSYVDNLIPHIYYGYYGKCPELSNVMETIIVMEDLSPSGFRMGPRVTLDEDHITLMTKRIAEYHSFSYALHLKKDPMLQTLFESLKPLSFITAPGELNFYDVALSITFQRLFKYYNEKIKLSPMYSSEFKNAIEELRDKYGKSQVELMEKFRQLDDPFSVFLHGDYNRNNVLFQYSETEGHNKPTDVKLIDFQEIRYGSPAIDLSFYLYFNMETDRLSELWDKMLKMYHGIIIDRLCHLNNLKQTDEALVPFQYDRFLEHFSRYAFYGVMICIEFLPVMMAPEEESERLRILFQTKMTSQEFRDCHMVIGGEQADEKIIQILMHAFEKGYLTNCLKL